MKFGTFSRLTKINYCAFIGVLAGLQPAFKGATCGICTLSWRNVLVLLQI